MSDFFFANWPNGAGPNLLQIALVLLGSVTGVRAIDDVRAWRAARAGNTSASKGD